MNKKTNKSGRLDLEIIADLIEKNSKVIDIGCGDGELLHILKTTKNADVRGLEISESSVSKAVSRGISVMQGDAAKDLPHYPDDSFDYAILSQTIQAMKEPDEVIKQMLRIAKFAIISLPNFAYFKNRFYLLLKGEMPVRKSIPHQWYNTPNIHFCTIDDFEKLCDDMGFYIKDKTYLTGSGKEANLLQGKLFPNFLAEFGLFMITKKDRASVTESEFSFNNVRKSLLKKNTVGLANNTK
jgi:methionine biosynthesis protein MetW